LGQDRTILALQSIGAAMGNMVAIHNKVKVHGTFSWQEGQEAN